MNDHFAECTLVVRGSNVTQHAGNLVLKPTRMFESKQIELVSPNGARSVKKLLPGAGWTVCSDMQADFSTVLLKFASDITNELEVFKQIALNAEMVYCSVRICSPRVSEGVAKLYFPQSFIVTLGTLSADLDIEYDVDADCEDE